MVIFCFCSKTVGKNVSGVPPFRCSPLPHEGDGNLRLCSGSFISAQPQHSLPMIKLGGGALGSAPLEAAHCWSLAHLVLLPGVLLFPLPLHQAHQILSQTSFTSGASLSSLQAFVSLLCWCGRGPPCLLLLCVRARVCSLQTCSSHRGAPTLYLVQHRFTFLLQYTLTSLFLFVLCFSSTRGAVCVPGTQGVLSGFVELKCYRMVRETPESRSDFLWSM